MQSVQKGLQGLCTRDIHLFPGTFHIPQSIVEKRLQILLIQPWDVLHKILQERKALHKQQRHKGADGRIKEQNHKRRPKTFMTTAQRSQLFNQWPEHEGNQKANQKRHDGIHHIAKKQIQQCKNNADVNKTDDKGSLFFSVHPNPSFALTLRVACSFL